MSVLECFLSGLSIPGAAVFILLVSFFSPLGGAGMEASLVSACNLARDIGTVNRSEFAL